MFAHLRHLRRHGRAGKHEALRPNPLSPYALQKIRGGKVRPVFHQLYGLAGGWLALLQRVRRGRRLILLTRSNCQICTGMLAAKRR